MANDTSIKNRLLITDFYCTNKRFNFHTFCPPLLPLMILVMLVDTRSLPLGVLLGSQSPVAVSEREALCNCDKLSCSSGEENCLLGRVY